MLLEFIAQHLILTPEYILTVANTASKRYKEYYIDKRDGTKRLIHHPSKELKSIQRCINQGILPRLPVHHCAAAYKPGAKLIDHVTRHKNSKYLLRLDFKDFFHRLTDMDIMLCLDEYKHFLPSDWNVLDSDLLIKLVCRYHKLTIGAATSPSLSNILCFKLDTQIQTLCDHLGVEYTRYADDMYFSTIKPNILYDVRSSVYNIVNSLKYPSNLLFNNRKTKHTSKKHRRVITGLVVTPTAKISIGRDKKRDIRSKIYNWNGLSVAEKYSLKGYLSYCNSVEPSFINSLCDKYTAGTINLILKYDESAEAPKPKLLSPIEAIAASA
ncbi:retron St85 family RNA-directed DNA polymerase [Geomesophilobacter sediminis]|uniref:RNA-directed DNA polymerase n=1 Tax=Geomesophilobacter sediminis TaxID=2798584 RepID=A0A8J7LWM9_9BACT|nr:retron St85 family RNA-directed DNA polymerase [Geomesophilobacter sediminis]MBJ6726010.1 retron St85 family RNA-directed DNA polymerase [Geomesophilobacter sediminis]